MIGRACTKMGYCKSGSLKLALTMCTFLGYYRECVHKCGISRNTDHFDVHIFGYNGNGVHRYGIFLKGVHRCGISNGGYCECSVILGLFEGVCTNLGFQGVRVHKSGIASGKSKYYRGR